MPDFCNPLRYFHSANSHTRCWTNYFPVNYWFHLIVKSGFNFLLTAATEVSYSPAWALWNKDLNAYFTFLTSRRTEIQLLDRSNHPKRRQNALSHWGPAGKLLTTSKTGCPLYRVSSHSWKKRRTQPIFRAVLRNLAPFMFPLCIKTWI